MSQPPLRRGEPPHMGHRLLSATSSQTLKGGHGLPRQFFATGIQAADPVERPESHQFQIAVPIQIAQSRSGGTLGRAGQGPAGQHLAPGAQGIDAPIPVPGR